MAMRRPWWPQTCVGCLRVKRCWREEVSGGDWVDVKCDAGRKVLGCGCEAQGPNYIFQSNAPVAGDTCECGGHGDNKRVWAFCASDITPVVQLADGGDTTVARCGASHLKVVGGGCNAKSGWNKMLSNGPDGDDAWKCSGQSSDKTVWAICQVLPSPSPTPVPTPSPTTACQSFTSQSCPFSRCVLVDDGLCTDYDWYILSEKADVQENEKEFKGTTDDETGCANLCGRNADAFVWASGTGSCWCTDAANNFLASDSGAATYRVGTRIKKDKACRLNEFDNSNKGVKTMYAEGITSLESCLSSCRKMDTCKGVQFREQSMECWLWTRYISRVVDQKSYTCVSVAERPVCSVTDGSGPSNNYPCQCGLAVCATENSIKAMNCFAKQNECRSSSTPFPTLSPTNVEDSFELWQHGKTCTTAIVGHCTGDARSCASMCRSLGAWHLADFSGKFVHCFQGCGPKQQSSNPSSNIWRLKR
eukprot:TRINITY_DN8044_c0_g1_i1.p1 TRINITY_DN8044_c0_g1~~TRINITY_DN8044_c0_g1_i1.p1  ORF type:complete len:475 (-),score=25.84 TRINITY_DN8044_c0_g1_i1:246-1670(-)